MTTILGIVAIIAVVIAVVYLITYYFNKSQTEEEARRIGPGKVPPYGWCALSYNCEGGKEPPEIGATVHCAGHECTPLVKDNFPGIYWNPKELGLHRYCGKFYTMGDMSRCNQDSQCDASGITKPLTDSSSRITTGVIPGVFYCNHASGRCESKGKWGGVYWKKGVFPPVQWLDFDMVRQEQNKLALRDIYKKMTPGSCRDTFLNDQPQEWAHFIKS